jgi:hypothetical protein
MLIIQEKLGMQLANRLFLFSHFIANAIEHNYVLINPTFDEYCQHFHATRNNDFGQYPIYTKFKINTPYNLFKFFTNLVVKIFPKSKWYELIQCTEIEETNLNDINFLNKVKSKTLLANGWLFRDPQNFSKHGDKIRAYFTPDKEITDKINELILDCKDKYDVVIGIHLRRGDYRNVEGGKYYFSDDVYLDKMNQIENYFNSMGNRTLFLMCSDESIEVNNFKKCSIKLGFKKPIEDLYSLAKCDYLLGPPSTYSMWASFYGKVPLLHINDPSQVVNLEEFYIVEE